MLGVREFDIIRHNSELETYFDNLHPLNGNEILPDENRDPNSDEIVDLLETQIFEESVVV